MKSWEEIDHSTLKKFLVLQKVEAATDFCRDDILFQKYFTDHLFMKRNSKKNNSGLGDFFIIMYMIMCLQNGAAPLQIVSF